VKKMASTSSQKGPGDKADEALPPEEQPELITPPVIITPHVMNPSREIILIWRTRSLHDHDHVLIEERERRERIVTSLVTIANSKIGGLICDYLLKHGGATIPELEKAIPTTRATASRTLKVLMNNDVVEVHGKVRPPYRARGQSGPRVPIFILKGADHQASIEAQKRYGDLVVSSREATLEVERQQRVRESQQREARALEVQNLTDRVFDALPRPLEKIKLAQVHDTMNLVGVGLTLRKDVKAAVINRIQEVGV